MATFPVMKGNEWYHFSGYYHSQIGKDRKESSGENSGLKGRIKKQAVVGKEAGNRTQEINISARLLRTSPRGTFFQPLALSLYSLGGQKKKKFHSLQNFSQLGGKSYALQREEERETISKQRHRNETN